jgi:hypothetical protein
MITITEVDIAETLIDMMMMMTMMVRMTISLIDMMRVVMKIITMSMIIMMMKIIIMMLTNYVYSSEYFAVVSFSEVKFDKNFIEPTFCVISDLVNSSCIIQ